MPAKAACSRTASRRASSDRLAQGLTPGLSGGNSVCAGTRPIAFCRARRSSRVVSQPFSNTGTYLSMYEAGAWCGACCAPKAMYRKKGLPGLADCWLRMKPIDRSTMSGVRW